MSSRLFYAHLHKPRSVFPILTCLVAFGVPPFCPEFLVEDILAQLAGNNWTSAESSIFLEKVLVVLYEA